MLKMLPNIHKFLRVAAFGVMIGAPLTSCTSIASFFGPGEEKHAPPIPAPRSSAASYAEHISLAELALETDPGQASGATPHLSAIKAFARQKPRKTERLTLVILEYKHKGVPATHQLVAAIDSNKNDFSSVGRVMQGLRESPLLQLQNVRVGATSVTPSRKLAAPVRHQKTSDFLEKLHQNLMLEYTALPPRGTIELQLSLAEFFTRERYQDAAYLSLDNAKRLLADAVHDQTLDADALAALSQRLEGLEGALKEQLPYKL